MRVVGTRIPTTGEDRKIYSTVGSTATAGQTVFAVNYDEGKVAVWLNGIRLVQGQDFSYTASGVGSQITLSSGIVANDYVEVVGYQGIYSGNALVEDRFVVGTSSTGSGGSYTNSTTVFPVANNTGDLVCVYRNGIKLVHTTDFVVSASGNTVTLQSASNTADEITVHVIGILQHSNFVPTSGGTFTGTVAHTGTLNVSGGTLTTSTAQKQTIVQAGPGSGTLDVSSGTLTTSTAQKDAIVDGSTAIARSDNNLTFAGNATVTGDLTVDTSTLKVDSSNNKVGINTASPNSFSAGANNLVVGSGSGDEGITVYSGSSNQGQIRFADGTSGAAAYQGRIEYDHSESKLYIGTNGSTQINIDSNGSLTLGTTSKVKQKGAFMQSSTHQALTLGY